MIEISEHRPSLPARPVGQAGTPATWASAYSSASRVRRSAETCIAYCRPGEEQTDDMPVAYDGFTRVDREAQRAVSGRRRGRLSGRPDGRPIDDQGAERACAQRRARRTDRRPHQLRLYNEINPGLASHGGQVTLLEVVDGNTAVLQFGGGCQGCSAVDITLKQGVERSLLAQIPELVAIRDSTDHTVASTPTTDSQDRSSDHAASALAPERDRWARTFREAVGQLAQQIGRSSCQSMHGSVTDTP